MWLLSPDSNWLPEKLHKSLLNGTLTNDIWLQNLLRDKSSSFIDILLEKDRDNFRYTTKIKVELENQIEKVITDLQIDGNAKNIMDKMLAIDIAKKYFEYREWLEEFRKKININK